MSKDKSNKDSKHYKPDWTPENAGKEFAVRVVKGYGSKQSNSAAKKRTSKYSVDDYVEGVLNDDRNLLARTITLIESNSHAHMETAQQVLQKLLPYAGNSLRIGISGVPGAGKSTLIESLGMYLIKKGHKVAVLTIDPSSSVTKGSILGDKTRMEQLSRESDCFIRPSPSGGALGGVTRKSRETITACEAAGFDTILIETVGVGQSEITVRSMVDFFLLVLIPGAGDELQGIKKGVIEIADTIAINKADGDNISKANIAKAEFMNTLHYLQPATKGWETKAVTCSAINGSGIENIWNIIKEFEAITKKSGVFERRRKSQKLEWTFTMIEEVLKESFYSNEKVKESLPKIKEEILKGKIPPTTAAEKLLDIYKSS